MTTAVPIRVKFNAELRLIVRCSWFTNCRICGVDVIEVVGCRHIARAAKFVASIHVIQGLSFLHDYMKRYATKNLAQLQACFYGIGSVHPEMLNPA